jgi:U4/U6.U5 tri-snRNP-associated protein 1
LFPQAKALEELDAEFGVGDLVEDEMRNDRREAYSSRDLRGLRVEHAVVSAVLVYFCSVCVI